MNKISKILIFTLIAQSATNMCSGANAKLTPPEKDYFSDIKFADIKMEEFVIPVMGGTVHCTKASCPATSHNTPLVCLHGGPGYTSASLRILFALALSRPVYIYDQLGGGASQDYVKGDDTLWTVDRFLDELDKVVGYFNLEKFHLWGSSWGGSLAAAYATQHPEKVHGLILASPLLNTTLWEKDTRALVSTMDLQHQEAFRLQENNKITKEDNSYKEALKAYSSKFMRRLPWTPSPWDRSQVFAINRYIYEFMWGKNEFCPTGNLRDFDILPDLRKFSEKNPVLITIGGHDEVSPETALEVPNAQVKIFSDSAHCAWREEPIPYLTTLNAFFSKIEKQKP